ncbi:hypothetical protein CISG_01506 [Coccidioides immitis RMSCC 3703]|uniref:Uncharacterized protein n=1 Tax=Coccidioides immitis RMSCC 3703 TaxID=454286 RepID=A0A0J8R099_COCIT|nr:hypothetical protein CISG_01506 [Coccidioides immitis RMSCC 3703]
MADLGVPCLPSDTGFPVEDRVKVYIACKLPILLNILLSTFSGFLPLTTVSTFQGAVLLAELPWNRPARYSCVDGVGVERVVPIYNNQQPKAIPPMKLVIYGDLPSPNEPHPPFLNISKWKTEGRDLASKLNKRKGLLSRVLSTNEQKRRMISAPTNFRRVPTQVNRRLSFRPLELSIYLPGNRLPDLPEFCDFDLDGPRVPPKAIWSPSFNSHHRRYSDTPSTFSVPRKPVGFSKEQIISDRRPR